MEFLNSIVLCDFYQKVRDIPDKSIDLVITDPPYRIHADNFGGLSNQRDWLKDIHDNDLDRFEPLPFLTEISRILKVFNAYIFCSKDLLVDYINYAVSMGYNWDLLIMAKRNPIPTKNNKYLPDTEHILFMREPGAYFNNEELFYKYKKVKHINVKKPEYDHPNEKPIHVIKELIEISSCEKDIVFDPFSGSGTTPAACIELNRQFIAFEKIEKHYNNSLKRLKGISINEDIEQKSLFDFDE